MTPEAILKPWGIPAQPPRFIKDRENEVFEVHLTDGTHAALRLHRPGYQTTQAISAELDWTTRLHAHGFPCPRPVPMQNGALVHILPDGTAASLIEWLPGTPIGEADQPFDGTADQQAEIYFKLGQLLRTLHTISDRPEVSKGISRPPWDQDALLGDAPFWGRFWENPDFSSKNQTQAQNLRLWVRNYLEARDWDHGLIHADAIQENVLTHAGHLSLIDFDDSGIGYRLYDLGAALNQHVDAPHLKDLRAALCGGYGNADPRDVAVFTLLRTMASAGWIIPRTTDRAIHARYGQRMLRYAAHICPEVL